MCCIRGTSIAWLVSKCSIFWRIVQPGVERMPLNTRMSAPLRRTPKAGRVDRADVVICLLVRNGPDGVRSQMRGKKAGRKAPGIRHSQSGPRTSEGISAGVFILRYIRFSFGAKS